MLLECQYFLCFRGSINLNLHGIFWIYRMDLSHHEWRHHLISPFCIWHISCAIYKFLLIDNVFHKSSLSQSHLIDLTFFEKSEFQRICILHWLTNHVLRWKQALYQMKNKIYFVNWINFIFRCILPHNVVKWIVNILCSTFFNWK